MKLLHLSFTELATVDALTFRERVSSKQPVVVVVNYAAMPFCTILFYPPIKHLWRAYPSSTVCDDVDFIDGDEEAERLLEVELKNLGGAAPISGILNVSDNLDRSSQKSDLGPWAYRFNTGQGRVASVYAYLDTWWSSVQGESTVAVDDALAARGDWWQDNRSLLEKNNFAFFLSSVWSMGSDLKLERLKTCFEKFRAGGRRLPEDSGLISPVVELFGNMPGHVMRRTFIQSRRPNKRLVRMAPNNSSDSLELRDEMYFYQCRFVNLLDRLSMYGRAKRSLADYRDSLKLSACTCSAVGDPEIELREYLERMASRYPVLEIERLQDAAD